MKTTINNEWIRLISTNNGLSVERKFGGLDTEINLNNEVTKCNVKYWERELYPNGQVNKCELKFYQLVDLDVKINELELYQMAERLVLTGFINNLGYSGIINPARMTLTDELVLPLGKENGYELHRDTREHLPYTPPPVEPENGENEE